MSPAAENSGISVTGTVLWFNPKKGYGFVKPDDGGADIFIHLADLADSGFAGLDEGERISFQRATHGDGRFFAVAIGKIGPAD